MGGTYLAYGRHNPQTWLWIGCGVAFYLLVSVLLSYRRQRDRGSEHPLREAMNDVGNQDRNQSGRQYFLSRLILIAGAIPIVAATFIPSTVLRVVVMVLVIGVVVALDAYYDYRVQRPQTEA